jgi:hypothetical protein
MLGISIMQLEKTNRGGCCVLKVRPSNLVTVEFWYVTLPVGLVTCPSIAAGLSQTGKAIHLIMSTYFWFFFFLFFFLFKLPRPHQQHLHRGAAPSFHPVIWIWAIFISLLSAETVWPDPAIFVTPEFRKQNRAKILTVIKLRHLII